MMRDQNKEVKTDSSKTKNEISKIKTRSSKQSDQIRGVHMGIYGNKVADEIVKEITTENTIEANNLTFNNDNLFSLIQNKII